MTGITICVSARKVSIRVASGAFIEGVPFGEGEKIVSYFFCFPVGFVNIVARRTLC